MTCLRDREHEDKPDTAENSHVCPEEVAPAFIHGQESTDDKSERRTKGGRHAVDGHWTTRNVSCPQIRDGATSVCQRSTSEESLDQSADDDCANVGGQGNRDLENDESEPTDSVDRVATKVLGQRSKKHRADGETLETN